MDSKDGVYYRLAFKIFAEFTGAIAVPAVIGALFGQWLDEKYGTEPRYLILFLALAFLFTAIFIVKKAKIYRDEYLSIMKKDV